LVDCSNVSEVFVAPIFRPKKWEWEMSENVVRKFLRNLKMYREKFLGNFLNLQPQSAVQEQSNLECRAVGVT
jgi:hypothetical protein